MLMRHPSLLMLVAAAAILACNSGNMAAQQTNGLETHPHAEAEISKSLTLHGLDKTLTFSMADLKAMPHKTMQVFNEHAKMNETYTGVPLTELLAQVGVPVGKNLRSKAFLLYILADGTDHYRVLYSLSEVDAENHAGEVIVADSLNGAALTTDGAFKLVSSEEKRPARWVRNLATITVRSADDAKAHP